MLHSGERHSGPMLQTPSKHFPGQPGLGRPQALGSPDPAAALRGGLLHSAGGVSASPPPNACGAVATAWTSIPGLSDGRLQLPGSAAPRIRGGEISANI